MSKKNSKQHLVEIHKQEVMLRWREHPELEWAIKEYRIAQQAKDDAVSSEVVSYYRGVMWALRNMYAMANNGCDTLEIDASPDKK